MRRGISYIAKRYSKANNKHCPDYDDKKPKNYIIYPKVNNLYECAMSQYLPYGRFKWVKTTNETVNGILSKIDNSLHGYFLEVDLEYPQYLHQKHSDYSLAPEKVKIKEEWLYPYCSEITNEHNIKTGTVKKLITNIMPKNNYVVHYRNLQYYLSKRLILKKVHNIIEFKQSAWMKAYVDFNTQKRKEATNEADKNLLKLLNNALYSKKMENMRKRIKIRMVIEKKRLY